MFSGSAATRFSHLCEWQACKVDKFEPRKFWQLVLEVAIDAGAVQSFANQRDPLKLRYQRLRHSHHIVKGQVHGGPSHVRRHFQIKGTSKNSRLSQFMRI